MHKYSFVSAPYILPVAVFVGSALLYMLNLDRFPHHDELYHVLAARSLLETGEPTIAEGLYERSRFFTWILARLYSLFGESLAIARIPSVITMAAVAGLMYMWIRQVANSSAAIIGSGLFAISPFAVDTALFIRFYAAQTLVFFIAAMFLYAAVEGKKEKQYLYIALAIPPMLAALYFQKTTMIGVAAIGTWITLRYASYYLQLDVEQKKRQGKIIVAVIIAAAIAFILLVQTGIFAKLLETYNYTSSYNRSRANEFWFYLIRYLQLYPTLLPAIGLIALFALDYKPKPAFFACVIFVVCLVLSSLAATKGMRYIIYAQPFFFILVGIGLAPLVKFSTHWLKLSHAKISASLPLYRFAATGTATAIILASVLLLIVGNPALARTIAMLSNKTIPPDRPKVDWMAAHKEIAPWIEKADVVVTMTELELLYYYGHYDLLLSDSRLGEIPGGEDFSPDYRTGRPVIASIAAMNSVLECYSTGIFVTNRLRWRHPDYIPVAIADLIIAKTEQLELPGRSQVLAFTWQHKHPRHLSESCAGLPQFRANLVS